jgi:two-component sensor histidine kinase/PAS domain-containing protein
MLGWLLQVADFMPHGMCLNWRPELMALHIVSDALIAVAYFAIPIGIAVFVQRRADLNGQHKALALLFAVFITACGLTHLMSILVLWQPYYVAEGVMKAFTALVSVGTAIALPFLLPQLLRIPSPKVLQAEIASHRTTLEMLEQARLQLANRVAISESDLADTTRRFETALRGSRVTVAEQDSELRYTWVYNPSQGLDLTVQTMLGKTEVDFLNPESADLVQTLKRRALRSWKPVREEIRIHAGARTGWFDMQIEPILVAAGEVRLAVTSTDISRLKEQEEHLRVIMRELNHRTKNLLTIIMSLARQTSRGFNVPEAFLIRLQDRLKALASAHDVLAKQEWVGADLRAVIQGQLQYQLEAYPNRISFVGDPCLLPAEAAHYVGMAVHELGSNAVKYGALSCEGGRVEIAWTVADNDDRTLELRWLEIGGPQVEPPQQMGFGSTILKTLTARATGGACTYEFQATGVRWTLLAPLNTREIRVTPGARIP